MKKTIIYGFLSLALAFNACKKDNAPEKAEEQTGVTAADKLEKSGMFMSHGRYSTSGVVEIYSNDTRHLIALKDFKTSNGPDLRVYLAKTTAANDFIDLGKLKAINGTFSYELAKRDDLAGYKEVLIWCEDFSVLFGSASL